MAKTNYRQAKKQKEFARKARQQEKQARKQQRTGDADAPPAGDAAQDAPADTGVAVNPDATP